MPTATKQPILSTAALKRQVVITENHGGHRGGTCNACGAGGWITGSHGLPHRVKNDVSTILRHKKSCPLNEYLSDHGRWQRRTPAQPKPVSKRSGGKRAERRLR